MSEPLTVILNGGPHDGTFALAQWGALDEMRGYVLTERTINGMRVAEWGAFTREDVVWLRRAAALIDSEWGEDEGDPGEQTALRDIARRIEALLPPE